MPTVKITATISTVPITVTIKDGPDDLRNLLRSLTVSALCNQQNAMTDMKVDVT